MSINFNNVVTADTNSFSEEDIERCGMEMSMRMQAWRDKVASGNLTDEEKKAIKNTEKLMAFDGDIMSDLSPSELRAMFN